MSKKKIKQKDEMCILIKQLTKPSSKLNWKDMALKEGELDRLIRKKIPEVNGDDNYNVQDALYTTHNEYYPKIRKLCN